MRPRPFRNKPEDSLGHSKDVAQVHKIGSPSSALWFTQMEVLGDQPHFFTTAAFSFPWGRVFDQGERVFEIVFLVLWLAFVVFLAYSAVRFLRENATRKEKSRRNDVIVQHLQRAGCDRWQRCMPSITGGSTP